MRRNKIQTIKGYTLPSPRLTAAGYWAMIYHIGLPLIGVLALADAALYLIFRYGFHQCYGVWCWF
ncbi:MAG: hypothetical protein MRY32_06675 [Rickettsiales bacterium]|nr:hypothetical protein [Rickettsiales bacterium]